MNFIDLFSGVGGFHQAIKRIYGDEAKCLFASEINQNAIDKYYEAYSINSDFDICDPITHNLIDEICISEELDLVCGGFPCQSFSHAGNQKGFTDLTRGTLYFQLSRIIKQQKPKYLLLENVRNLLNHDEKRTWNTIYNDLKSSGYFIDYIVLSPNQINDIPAIRDRIFILGYREDIINEENLALFNGVRMPKHETNIYDMNGELNSEYFDAEDREPNITEEKIRILNMWDDFRSRILKNGNRMITPIWTEFFKSNLILDDKIPNWKKKIIYKNHNFYLENRAVIDNWMKDYNDLWKIINASNKKFEWNAGENTSSIKDCIIQFRPSGVRAKKSDNLPTFVAINQTPIIGRYFRYIKPCEMAKLYGFKNIRFDNNNISYKLLGNTVSVDVVEYLLRHMLENEGILRG